MSFSSKKIFSLALLSLFQNCFFPVEASPQVDNTSGFRNGVKPEMNSEPPKPEITILHCMEFCTNELEAQKAKTTKLQQKNALFETEFQRFWKVFNDCFRNAPDLVQSCAINNVNYLSEQYQKIYSAINNVNT